MSLKPSATYRIQIQNPPLILNLVNRMTQRQDGSQRLRPRSGDYAFPLEMVLDACPDLTDYARAGIGNWREFLVTVATVRPMLGISPSAWEEASKAMGEGQAAIVVACILQRSSSIGSAGGYLRDLARRSRAGEFSIGPMVMALLFNQEEKREPAGMTVRWQPSRMCASAASTLVGPQPSGG